MRGEAQVVVIGSGGFGASTAYHLARRGVRDVVLLDRHELGSQTSPRAAGLTSKVASTELMVRLVHEAVETLASMEATTGRSVGFRRVGAMRVMRTPEGEARMRRDGALARRLGVKVEFLSTDEAERMAPYFHAGSARAILFSPEDGYFHPPWSPGSSRPPRPTSGRPSGPTRPSPRSSTGRDGWRRSRRHGAGSRRPWSWTRRAPGRGSWPMRSASACRWCRRGTSSSSPSRSRESGRSIRSSGSTSRACTPAPSRAASCWAVTEHFPVLRGAAIREHRGGLPTLSPDGRHIVGPVEGLAGFYVATACNVGGLSISAAIGRVLADLIATGHAEPDLAPFALERFRGRFGEPADLAAACRGAYARKYTRA